MLFVFDEERIPSFTMRGMRFPLDFVWISADRRVVDVTEDVPAPAAPGDELSGISPGDPVLWVLEVNAGLVSEEGIGVGDDVTFEPEP